MWRTFCAELVSDNGSKMTRSISWNTLLFFPSCNMQLASKWLRGKSRIRYLSCRQERKKKWKKMNEGKSAFLTRPLSLSSVSLLLAMYVDNHYQQAMPVTVHCYCTLVTLHILTDQIHKLSPKIEQCDHKSSQPLQNHDFDTRII